MGDLNELIRGDEKLGGNRISHNQMQLFHNAIVNVDSLTLPTQVQNSFGGSTLLVVSQFGRDWTEHFAQMISYNSLG